MNRLSFFIVIFLLAIQFQSPVWSQDNYKFGKISHDELTMKQYAPDTPATAVYLYMKSSTKFTYSATLGTFGTETDYAYRIKILKPEGKEYADITIPFSKR